MLPTSIFHPIFTATIFGVPAPVFGGGVPGAGSMENERYLRVWVKQIRRRWCRQQEQQPHSYHGARQRKTFCHRPTQINIMSPKHTSKKKPISRKTGPEPLLTTAEVADILGVTPYTVRAWLNDPRHPLSGIKIGRHWRVSPDKLRAFLKGG